MNKITYLLFSLFSLCLATIVNGQIANHFTCPAGTTTQTFDHTGALQTFVVPANVTQLTIVGAGASGGGNDGFNGNGGGGGAGGVLGATYTVTPGETLTILVGGKGIVGSDSGFFGGNCCSGGGGGGGTFVFRGSVTLANLLIAVGGGGGRGSGGPGQSSQAFVTTGAANGGTALQGGAGAGISTDGADDTEVRQAHGGQSIIAGGAGGGLGIGDGGEGGPGGYGGGGEGEEEDINGAGGGGGGYIGGNALGTDVGGQGGTSFLPPGTTPVVNQVAGNPSSAVESIHGQLLVCYTASPAAVTAPIPTMSQWGLIIFGLLVLNLGIIFLYIHVSLK